MAAAGRARRSCWARSPPRRRTVRCRPLSCVRRRPRPTGPWRERPAHEVLDLGVGAAQVVAGPTRESLVDGGIELQRPLLRSLMVAPRGLPVETAVTDVPAVPARSGEPRDEQRQAKGRVNDHRDAVRNNSSGTTSSLLARNFFSSIARCRRCREEMTDPSSVLNAANSHSALGSSGAGPTGSDPLRPPGGRRRPSLRSLRARALSPVLARHRWPSGRPGNAPGHQRGRGHPDAGASRLQGRPAPPACHV